MSNILELNVTEIDTVVGGVNAAMIQQMSVSSRPTNTMVHVPNKTPTAGSFSAGNYDLSALQAQISARR